jgi:predicted DsbA family dithiol-disulfide isomerase
MDAKPVIQVVSDVVCPWCYIGKRRLEKALGLLPSQDVAIHWTAFELNPAAPPEGWSRREYRIAKFGGAEVSARLEARVVEAGAQEGIAFRFDLIEKTPNTFDAHRLIRLAAKEASQDTLVENLFRSYFIEGLNIGDRAVLIDIATASGLPGARVRQLLESNEAADEVRQEEAATKLQGVSGVPTFFLQVRPLTSEAHPPLLLAAMLAPLLQGESCSAENSACR